MSGYLCWAVDPNLVVTAHRQQCSLLQCKPGLSTSICLSSKRNTAHLPLLAHGSSYFASLQNSTQAFMGTPPTGQGDLRSGNMESYMLYSTC